MLLTFPQTNIFDSGGGADEDPIYHDGTWVHPVAWRGANTEMRRVLNRFKTDATTRQGAAEYYGPIGAAGDTFESFVTLTVLATTTNDSVDLALMTTSGTADDIPSGYVCYLKKTASGWELVLARIDENVYTTIVLTTGVTISAGVQLGFRRDGSGLRAFIDGVQKLAAVDTAHVAPYFATFGANDVATGSSTWQLTNVGGGAYG